MYKKAALFALIAVSAYFLVSITPRTQIKGHNLISQQKAEAFTMFEQWIYKHAKVYEKQGQKSYRFGRFFQNYLFVKEHQAKYTQGKQTFDVQLNKFADLDNFEFRALYTGLKKSSQVTSQCTGEIDIMSDPPKEVDWVDKAVGSVKNQGQCGSCWAFSAAGALEGLYALTNDKIVSFAPQQLVDCAGGPYENEGCNGGDMPNAFWYVIDHGIALEQKYPYKAKDQKCSYKQTMNFYQNKNCAHVPANKTIALQSAVARQPVSISVEADSLRFQFYSKGVFSGKCGIDLDHGIVLAGYGNLDGSDYWKCKNSWGADWGQKGYILLARGEDGPGQCGVLMDNSVPLA